MKNQNHILTPSENYALLDSGNGRKLEKFGNYTIIRPEKQALWKESNSSLWQNADAEYVKTGDKFGDWKFKNPIPQPFVFHHDGITLSLKLTPFGHVGIFPEQSEQWDFIRAHSHPQYKILSLFSYTGSIT